MTSAAALRPGASVQEPDSLFITLGAAFHRWEGRLYVESQSISGLKTWAENFSRIKACSVCKHGPPPPGWSEAEAGGLVAPAFELVDLPDGYHLPTFLRHRSALARRLAEVMSRCTYRSLAIGGWIGDGVLLDRMKAEAQRLGILGSVTFHGFVSDRARVLGLMQQAQIMLFCHMTDESPRNLVEALHAATPLVGFADPYAASLVSEQGAGRLVPRGDTAALVKAVATLHADRPVLADLIGRAGRSARHLTRSQIYRVRRDLIRTHLGPQTAAAVAV